MKIANHEFENLNHLLYHVCIAKKSLKFNFSNFSKYVLLSSKKSFKENMFLISKQLQLNINSQNISVPYKIEANTSDHVSFIWIVIVFFS